MHEKRRQDGTYVVHDVDNNMWKPGEECFHALNVVSGLLKAMTSSNLSAHVASAYAVEVAGCPTWREDTACQCWCYLAHPV